MNKKIDEQFRDINDKYLLQCICTEMKDKIEELEKIIYKAKKMIYDNYGLLDKYEIEILEDILKGDNDEY